MKINKYDKYGRMLELTKHTNCSYIDLDGEIQDFHVFENNEFAKNVLENGNIFKRNKRLTNLATKINLRNQILRKCGALFPENNTLQYFITTIGEIKSFVLNENKTFFQQYFLEEKSAKEALKILKDCKLLFIKTES